MATRQRVAVVTGANKGIGLAIVKGLLQQFHGAVYLTSRDEARGRAAVEDLNKLGLEPQYHQLDVTDRSSVIRFRDHIKNTHGGIDILINNAAIANTSSLFDTHEQSKVIIDVNYRSILTVQEILFPLVRDNGRILNISSDCGHFSNIRNKHWIDRLSRKDLTVQDINEFVDWFLEGVKNGTFDYNDLADGGTVAAYRVAKVALSAVTILQAKELEGRGIAVNHLHPGLVRTDMTNSVGFYSPEQAARTPLRAVLDAPAALRGAYIWHDGTVLDWYDHTADYYFKSKTLEPEK